MQTARTMPFSSLDENVSEEVAAHTVENPSGSQAPSRSGESPSGPIRADAFDPQAILIDLTAAEERGNATIPRELRERLRVCLTRGEQEQEALRKKLEDVERHSNNLEAAINLIITSKSWKLTAPLRWAIAFKRKLLPLLSNERTAFDLVPGRSVVRDGESYRVVGPSPTVELRPRGVAVSDEGRDTILDAGWYRVRASATAEQSPLFFLLYYRAGKGFNGHDRIWLALEPESTAGAPFRLRAPIEELRLDPFDVQSQFSVGEFSIERLGSLQVIWHRLRRQLLPVLYRKHLIPMARNPREVPRKVKNLVEVIRDGGLTGLRARLMSHESTQSYDEWVKRYDTLTEKHREQIRRKLVKFSYKPLMSVVMPVYNTPEKYLRLAIESVRRQLYPNWELCIADDGSRPDVQAVLREYAAKDSRIKVVFREKNGHICAASNSALALAEGDFVALLDHDDELSEHALSTMVEELNRDQSYSLLYSDEDKMTGFGQRFNPYFKSDWNPELFRAQNFVCHLTVIRRRTIESVGGFREGFEGAQDWDLMLRVVDSIPEAQIRHVPHILYHWRAIEGSTAQATAFKPYVLKNQVRSVEDHLKRRGFRGATVEIIPEFDQLRVRYPIPEPAPLVSIIIPTRDHKMLLAQTVESIVEKSTYRNFEIIVVDNGSTDRETLEYLATRSADGVIRVIRDDQPFNFSRINNIAVQAANGELIGFLNNDLEVITPEWLTEMVSHAIQPEVGAVGSRLLFPNNLLQHAGIILGIGGIAGHNHKGREKNDPGYFNRAALPQNMSAVTAACLIMRRSVFDEIGGFDQVGLTVAFNDVDLCLRVRDRGYRIVYTPYAELYHYESASRGYENTPEKFMRFEREIETMKERWGAVLKADPYYNPNLTVISEDFSFSFPPRVKRPWE